LPRPLDAREIKPVPTAQEAGSPEAGLDFLGIRYFIAPARTRNSDRSARSLVTIITELYWLLTGQRTKTISLHLERRAHSQISSQIIKFESMLTQPNLAVTRPLAVQNHLHTSVNVN
jgi:hypothetical protein